MSDDTEAMTIEWRDFGTALASDLWQFYNSSLYSDVTIYTEDGHEIKSHRILLAMCSEYFHELFQKNQAPNCVVCLSNMRFDIVKKIMTLIYAGSVKVLESEMDRFVAATKYLKLKGFGNVNENMGDADSENDQNSEHNYTIRLDRIDAKQCATTSKNKSTGKRPSTSNVFPSSRLQNIDLNQEKFFPSDSDDSDGLNEPSSESDDVIID